jgi:signal peptidase
MPRAREHRNAASVVGDTVLTLLAGLGTLCIALVIAALIFDVSIVLFRTGSMSPGIPAGSAALVREVPAASLGVGDIVTVDRAGKLPITHRVVGIERAGEGDARSLTLRGDANAVDDPAPYEVTSARLLLFAVPGIAPGLAAMGHPLVLGSLTIGATALVLWAFWPRRRDGADRVRGARGRVGQGRHRDGSPASAGRGAALVLVAGTVLGASVLAPWAAAPPAAAVARVAVEETVVHGQVLRLTSIGDGERMRRMAPGERVAWEVGISADTPEPGEVAVSLSGSGDLGLGLVGDVRVCAVRWEHGSCPAAVTLVEDARLPVDGVGRALFTMSTDEERWLRFDVALPDQPAPAHAAVPRSVELIVRAIGASDDVAVGMPGTGGAALADTGASIAAPLITAGVLAVGGVLLLLPLLRRRMPRPAAKART